MKTKVLSFFVAVCSLLSVSNASATIVIGSGFELNAEKEVIKFKSETTFNEAGIRTAETRTYVDEAYRPIQISRSTFNFRGQVTRREYFDINNSDNPLCSIVFDYDSEGNLVNKTKTNSSSEIEYSYQWSFDYEYNIPVSMYSYNKETKEIDGIVVKDPYYEYVENDEQGRIIASEYYSFEDSGYKKIARDEYDYDPESGNLATQTTYFSDAMTNTFRLSMMFEYSYTENNKKSSEVTYTRSNENTWEIMDKSEYTYDENGNILSTTYLNWDGSQYVNSTKDQYEYNALGLETLHQFYRWENNDWVVLRRDEVTYNELGMITGKKSYYRSSSSEQLDLISSTSSEYSFNEDGYVSVALNKENEEVSDRIEYTYDEINNKNVSAIYQYWEDNEGWIPYKKTIHREDAEGRETDFFEYEYDDIREWVCLISFFSEYNEKGRPTRINLLYPQAGLNFYSDLIYYEDDNIIDKKYYAYVSGKDIGLQRINNDYYEGRLMEQRYYEWDNEKWTTTDEIVYNYTWTSVDAIESAVAVRGGRGRIEVAGASNGLMRVVKIGGMEVYNNVAASIAAQPGLYIVEIDGKATKVVVE